MTVGQPASRFTLLICTVGGTPEPVVQTLLHWRPTAVRFVVSAQTGQVVDVALRSYAENTSVPLSPGCYKIISVDDPEDLSAVVTSVRSLAGDVGDWYARGDDYDVIADFTGGTKCMSAALALVARRWRCEFSYIGGARRSKNGIGIVESGSERVVHSANPWDALGYQVIEDAVIVFKNGGYAAAAGLLDDAVKSTDTPAVKRELSTLKALYDAYAAWDRFDHKTAKQRFEDVLKNRNDLAAIFTDAQELQRRIDAHKTGVSELAGQTEPTTAWVKDLVRNAQRRAAERRFDDAAARLYRAFEALAQVRLREKHGIADTKSVQLSKLPSALCDEWKDRARDGVVSIGLQEVYRLLQVLDDDLGHRFINEKLNDKESPLTARNQSILAHGFQPVGQPIYEELRKKFHAVAELDSLDEDKEDWSLPKPR